MKVTHSICKGQAKGTVLETDAERESKRSCPIWSEGWKPSRIWSPPRTTLVKARTTLWKQISPGRLVFPFWASIKTIDLDIWQFRDVYNMSLMVVVFNFFLNGGQPISLGHRKLSLGATLLYLNPVFLTRSTTGRNGNDQTLLKKKRKALFITQLTEILDWLFSIEFFAVPFLSLSSSAARRSRSLGLSVTTVSEWMVF